MLAAIIAGMIPANMPMDTHMPMANVRIFPET
jgi:hypothetical protein